MRIATISLAMAFVLSLPVLGADSPATETLDLWSGSAPGEKGAIGEEKAEKGPNDGILRITNVMKPTITIYRPERGKQTGTAIVICPGGGYNILAYDHEGEQVGQWLRSIGVTGVLLKYRVPRREGTPKDQPPPQALMDAQRALSLVRSKAADWGIDAKRIGILGFSAGGHLGAWAATNFDKRAYDPVDAADKVDCRPDFAVLVYPGGVFKKSALAPEIHVTSQTPPMFLAHAGDDRVTPENSVQLYLALKQAGVPAEMHIYASGGHGFGMRKSDKPCASWPQRCEDWMHSQGLLKNSSANAAAR